MEDCKVMKTNVWDRGCWAKAAPVSFDFMTYYILEHIVKSCVLQRKRVLELGAGSGRLSYLMLAQGAAHVTLVDSSRRACEISRRLFQSKDPETYSVVEEDILTFSPGSKYDLVFSSGVIEHFNGINRGRIVLSHIEHALSDVIMIHPADTPYITLFNRSYFAVKRYGYQRSFSEVEMDGYLRPVIVARSWTHKRFHPFYSMPFLHNLSVLNRTFDKAFGGKYGALTMTHVQLFT
jgi:SAM-dependent methyltransferase